MKELIKFASPFINGAFLSQPTLPQHTLVNPATGKPLVTVLNSTPALVDAAVDAARTALKDWRRTSGKERR